MSPRDWQLRISDILEAISDIKSFVSGISFEQFKTDKKTYLAVIRSLEVIGEASNHVPEKIKQKYTGLPWRKLKDFRNILTHEYFGVDDQILWRTINDNLLPLYSQFEKILSSEREGR